MKYIFTKTTEIHKITDFPIFHISRLLSIPINPKCVVFTDFLLKLTDVYRILFWRPALTATTRAGPCSTLAQMDKYVVGVGESDTSV